MIEREGLTAPSGTVIPIASKQAIQHLPLMILKLLDCNLPAAVMDTRNLAIRTPNENQPRGPVNAP